MKRSWMSVVIFVLLTSTTIRLYALEIRVAVESLTVKAAVALGLDYRDRAAVAGGGHIVDLGFAKFVCTPEYVQLEILDSDLKSIILTDIAKIKGTYEFAIGSGYTKNVILLVGCDMRKPHKNTSRLYRIEIAKEWMSRSS